MGRSRSKLCGWSRGSGLVYGENAAWIATDDTRSTVIGNVGVALPPCRKA
jgi:hypothetical protein